MVGKDLAYGWAFRAGFEGVLTVRAGRVRLLSVGNRPIRPGCGESLMGRRGPGQVRQGIEGGGLIEQADVGVDSQGQGRRRMACEGLDDLDRGVAHRQGGDVGVPQGVEVGHPRIGLIGHASGLQVASEHQGGMFGQLAPDGLAGGSGGQPEAKGGGKLGLDGLNVVPTALGIGGLDCDRRRVGCEVERLGSQGSEFVRPEPGPHCDPIERRPVRARLLQDDGAMLGGIEDAADVGGIEGAANPAAVGVRVGTGQVGQRVLSGSAVPPEPSAESLGLRRVVMDRPQRGAIVADRFERGLDLGRGQSRDAIRSGQLDDAGHPVAAQVGMLQRCPSGQQVGMPVGQVVGQRPGLMLSAGNVLGVNQTGPDLGGL